MALDQVRYSIQWIIVYDCLSRQLVVSVAAVRMHSGWQYVSRGEQCSTRTTYTMIYSLKLGSCSSSVAPLIRDWYSARVMFLPAPGPCKKGHSVSDASLARHH